MIINTITFMVVGICYPVMGVSLLGLNLVGIINLKLFNILDFKMEDFKSSDFKKAAVIGPLTEETMRFLLSFIPGASLGFTISIIFSEAGYHLASTFKNFTPFTSKKDRVEVFKFLIIARIAASAMHFFNWILIDQFGLLGFLTAIIVHGVYNYNGARMSIFFAKFISDEFKQALKEQYAS
jgi:hypothetical protein